MSLFDSHCVPDPSEYDDPYANLYDDIFDFGLDVEPVLCDYEFVLPTRHLWSC